jgi:hypothetical protein
MTQVFVVSEHDRRVGIEATFHVFGVFSSEEEAKRGISEAKLKHVIDTCINVGNGKKYGLGQYYNKLVGRSGHTYVMKEEYIKPSYMEKIWDIYRIKYRAITGDTNIPQFVISKRKIDDYLKF